MKKLFRIGVLAAAFGVLMIVILTVVAKVLITPERVRATVLPLAEKALQRPVELGEIKVGLFSGISLQELVVREKEGDEVFIATEKLVLRYQLWPLLRLKVVVDEVSLEQPRIRVERLADGSFNFSDLADGGDGTVSSPVGEGPAAGAGMPPLDLLVSSVSLRGGELLFIDQAAGGSVPLRYELNQLEVTASDISLNRSFPFAVSGLVNKAPLMISGQLDPAAAGGSAAISLVDLDIAAFTPYFREAIPGRLNALKLGLNLQVQGGSGQLAASGKVLLTDLGLVLDALEETPIRDGRLIIEHDLVFSQKDDRLDIKSLQLDYNGIVVAASGHLEQLAAGAAADLTVRLPPLDLKKAIAAVPEALVRELAALDPAGKVEAEARLAGPLDQPENLLASAWFGLQKVQVTMGGLRPSIAGRFELAGDRLTARDLVLGDGTNQAQLELSASNVFGKPVMVKHSLTAGRFLLDPLLAAGAAAPTATQETATSTEELGPFNIPVTAEGRVRIGETLYKGLAIRDFDLIYRLENNVLSITRLNGSLAEGHFANTARVDLGKTPIVYQGRLDLKEIQAGPFVNAFMPNYTGMVTGALSFDFDASGRGTLPEIVKPSLMGKGSLMIGNGRFANTPMVQDLATFLGLEELRELSFSQASGSFTIRDGRLSLNSEIKGGDMRMAPRGTVGLDGKLDLSLMPRLSPKLSGKIDSKGQFTRYLKDDQGWSELPLKVAGDVTAPRFSLDSAGVRQQVEQKAREKVEETIQRQLLDRLGLPGQPAQQGAEQVPEEKKPRQMLDDAVRGLFGR
jgi:AsmA protein